MVPFNKPYITGKEIENIQHVINGNQLSGNGEFTKKCHHWFNDKYGFANCLLTTSCTDALEMSAILTDVQPGDEIIMPSYTFVSTANAFILRGASIVFADSYYDNPNIDPSTLEPLINERTKAIVAVHYAGISCDMAQLTSICEKYNLFLIEDAAQAIDSTYKELPLGSIGDLSCFSFHETKNIISGEGGMLVINNEKLKNRAEIIWEKGTNRSSFHRGEIDKYGWVDIGSSFLPSELIAAFLLAQLSELDSIQIKRKKLWNRYNLGLKSLQNLDKISLPSIPNYASTNGHLYYLVCKNGAERKALINHLKKQNINAVFHYLSLHKSHYFRNSHDYKRSLPNSDRFTDCLLRLPLYMDLDEINQDRVIESIYNFYKT